MSVALGTIEGMDFTTPNGRAFVLGQDHAEDEHNGEAHKKLYAGRQIAAVLGLTDDLSGDEYVALRESYQQGWSSFW